MRVSSLAATTTSPSIRTAPTTKQSNSHQVDSVEIRSSGRLSANPLFAQGAAYDEFALTSANVDFAQQQFGLDDALVEMVRNPREEVALSVVYHNTDSGLQVDAYRAAVVSAPGSTFSVYKAVAPDFDPAPIYRNELFTPLPSGGFFGSTITSKEVAVPEFADQALKELLRSNEFEPKRETSIGELGYSQQLKDYFGLSDEMGLEMYQLREKSFTERFQVFLDLLRDDPEYRVLKAGDVLGDVGAAVLLGVITPKLWEQGAAYGIAGTISSIGNIGSPLVGILGESFLGSVVDQARNSERPMESLKQVSLYTAGLSTVTAACYFGLHPEVIGALPLNPGHAFLGLYATSVLSSGISGVMSGKANLAIHDQIINKGPNSTPEYSKNFFQIMGVEASLSRAIYLGSYTATVAAASAFPQVTIGMAGVGAALWAGSNFLFPLYRDKPEMEVTVEGGAYVHRGNSYVFDSGWEVEFDGPGARLVQQDSSHFSISFEEGEMRIKNPEAVSTRRRRRWKDYLPKFLKPEFLGEKENWRLDDGQEQVEISRYGHSPYRLETLSEHEFLLTAQPEDEKAKDHH